MDYYISVLRNYAVFEGRARREEYWYFVLFNVIAVVLLNFLDGFFGMQDKETQKGLLTTVYTIAVLVPSIAVAVRRLHDTNRSGWWILLYLIPLLGALVLFIFFVFDSEKETNEYGVNPKLKDFNFQG